MEDRRSSALLMYAESARGVNLLAITIALLIAPATYSEWPLAAAAIASLTTRSASVQMKDGKRIRSLFATFWNSVRTGPGQNAITVTPVPRSSAATASLKLSTNALVAPYVAMYGVA